MTADQAAAIERLNSIADELDRFVTLPVHCQLRDRIRAVARDLADFAPLLASKDAEIDHHRANHAECRLALTTAVQQRMSAEAERDRLAAQVERLKEAARNVLANAQPVSGRSRCDVDDDLIGELNATLTEQPNA